MEFVESEGIGKNLEEARENALFFLNRACNYEFEIKDCDEKIIQLPVDKLFTKKNAIVILNVKQEVQSRIIEEEKKEYEDKIKKYKQEKEKKVREKQEKIIKLTEEYRKYTHGYIDYFPTVPIYFAQRIIAVAKSLERIIDLNLNNITEDFLYLFDIILQHNCLQVFDMSTYCTLQKYIFNKYLKSREEYHHKAIAEYYKKTMSTEMALKMADEYIVSSRRSIEDKAEFENNDRQRGIVRLLIDIMHGVVGTPEPMLYAKEGSNITLEADVLDNYVFDLYLLGMFPFVVTYGQMLISNEELFTIVNNINKESIYNQSAYNELHDIYSKYYNDTFPLQLNVEELRMIAVAAEIIYNKGSEREKNRLTLEMLNVSVDEITADAFSQVDDLNDVFDVIFNKYVETGTFDNLFESPEHEKLNNLFLGELVTYALDSFDVTSWLAFCIVSASRIKDFYTYYKKYTLLHYKPDMNLDQVPLSDSITQFTNLREKLEKVTTGVEFENFLKEYYEKMGYEAKTTKATGDQGADLILEKEGIRTIVQAKYYSSPVGNSAVQEVTAALKFYNAERGVVATNSTFTRAARELATANEIKLIDGYMLSSSIEAIL